MPTDPQALAPVPLAEAELEPLYESLLSALAEHARGRAFLAEYARRNRAADTDMLLAALSRLEANIAREGLAAERLRDELRVLLIAVRLARPEIETAAAAAKAAKLGALLDLLESRIAAIAGETSGEARLPAETYASFDAPDESPAASSADPLAPLLALSEDERLALFT